MSTFVMRTMKMSEHSDESWQAVFDCEDDERRNYCVVALNSYGIEYRIVEDLLTHKEAKDAVKWYQFEYNNSI